MIPRIEYRDVYDKTSWGDGAWQANHNRYNRAIQQKQYVHASHLRDGLGPRQTAGARSTLTFMSTLVGGMRWRLG